MRKADCTPEVWATYLEKTRRRLKAWRDAHREEFNADRRAKYNKNPKKQRQIQKAWRARNKDRVAAVGRLRRTGMSDSLYKSLVNWQSDACAVCLRPFGGERRCADHDHGTKEPRGLLCIYCNATEGHAKKVGLAPGELGRRLDSYLANPPAREVHAS
jgi:hypothetical protein